jgi:hypothetical protein
VLRFAIRSDGTLGEYEVLYGEGPRADWAIDNLRAEGWAPARCGGVPIDAVVVQGRGFSVIPTRTIP